MENGGVVNRDKGWIQLSKTGCFHRGAHVRYGERLHIQRRLSACGGLTSDHLQVLECNGLTGCSFRPIESQTIDNFGTEFDSYTAFSQCEDESWETFTLLPSNFSNARTGI